MSVAVLCCAAGVAAGGEQPDARLLEAQKASDEATRLREAGDYNGAIRKSEHALMLREAVLGGMHPAVADSLIDLALAYCQKGMCVRAEPLYVRALAIQEAALGKHHPGLARLLSCLGVLYMSQGLYAQAQVLFERAIAIEEATLDKDRTSLAIAIHNLAVLYIKQGLYARAKPLVQRAHAIWEAALGKHHPNLSLSLNSLAKIYQGQGLYARAEPLFQRAIALMEADISKHRPQVAHLLTSLANLYYQQGLYARAEPLYERALALREAALGPRHPSVADSLNNLAQLHLARHRFNSALPLLTRAFTLSEQELRQEALDCSESRLTRLLQSLRTDEERLYSLLRAHPDDPRVQRLAFTSVLLRKGRSVEEIADTSRTIYRSLGAQDRDTFERLRALRTQLAQFSLAGRGPLSLDDYQQRLKTLADQGDALEADLAKRSAPLRALTALPAPAEIVDRVAATLPPGSALIEFIAYADRPLVPKPGTADSQVPSHLRYQALVLFSDARIRALDLGPAASIDRAASNLRDALARRDAAYPLPAQTLYSRVFEPLLPLLGDVRRLFIAPDGQLNLIPFDALHDGNGFLGDSFDFSYLTSGKELLPRGQGLPPADSVVVLAAPDFDAPSATPSPSPMGASSEDWRSPSLERFFSTLRTGSAEQSWMPLPGTRQEAESIQRLFPQAQLFLGPDATKQRLLQLAAPGVLHIATHGFFLEDGASPRDSRAIGYFGALGDDVSAQRPPDPLLRSGLVLSGARTPAAPNTFSTASTQAESSLVTALELAGLDLWGTQLVVLSACDTGRGDIKLREGIYGLRRAFVIAGAETVVMSLWKVNDNSTSVLMEHYYRSLLAGKGRTEALRDAMRALREVLPHPYYWAPFIALGQDTPLRSLAPPPADTVQARPALPPPIPHPEA